ncbi:MAG TPA: hypothetical protein VI968_03820 [archaeon]|nr:hypothetical protein [archaeon]
MNNKSIAAVAIISIALATSVGFAMGSTDSDFSFVDETPPVNEFRWCPASWYNGACFLTSSGCWTCYSCCGPLCSQPYVIC